MRLFINFNNKITKLYPAFTDQDIMHLWKGLFFCMWMSDKPLTQEKLAENLASLLHCFDKKDVSIRFYGAFLKIMGKEWFGIDQWRIDKFMMVKRRVELFGSKVIFIFFHYIITAGASGNKTSFRCFAYEQMGQKTHQTIERTHRKKHCGQVNIHRIYDAFHRNFPRRTCEGKSIYSK